MCNISHQKYQLVFIIVESFLQIIYIDRPIIGSNNEKCSNHLSHQNIFLNHYHR